MKLIRFISTLVVVAFLMAAIGSSAWADGTKRPNIIFILTDDISPKDYAFYGGKTVSPWWPLSLPLRWHAFIHLLKTRCTRPVRN